MASPYFRLLLSLLFFAFAQADLLDQITPNLFTLNPPVGIIFGTEFRAETPIGVRFTLMLAVAEYNFEAVCHPTALDFWGKRSLVAPSRLCNNRDERARTYAHVILSTLARDFPPARQSWASFLTPLGFNPSDVSTDTTTAIGLGNVIGNRIADFFVKDGWNSQSKVPYFDNTGYRPLNAPLNIMFPLRWTPLVVAGENRAQFFSQIHLTPQITRLRPYTLTDSEAQSRTSTSPYQNPNRRKISTPDREAALDSIQGLLKITSTVTEEQRDAAKFWDNKFASVGAVGGFYSNALNLSVFETRLWQLSESLAFYDTLLVTWREKRRQDLVRPETLISQTATSKRRWAIKIRRALNTKLLTEFKSLFTAAAHSEFPSLSAALCRTGFEHAENYIKVRNLASIPPTLLARVRVLPELSTDRTFRFNTFEEAAQHCGMSRLWAGVHFRPAVDAGLKLTKGVGRLAFAQMDALANGIVPDSCRRCIEVE